VPQAQPSVGAQPPRRRVARLRRRAGYARRCGREDWVSARQREATRARRQGRVRAPVRCGDGVHRWQRHRQDSVLCPRLRIYLRRPRRTVLSCHGRTEEAASGRLNAGMITCAQPERAQWIRGKLNCKQGTPRQQSRSPRTFREPHQRWFAASAGPLAWAALLSWQRSTHPQSAPARPPAASRPAALPGARVAAMAHTRTALHSMRRCWV
jgi:hypothetical protein